jgi:hypothetical protein
VTFLVPSESIPSLKEFSTVLVFALEWAIRVFNGVVGEDVTCHVPIDVRFAVELSRAEFADEVDLLFVNGLNVSSAMIRVRKQLVANRALEPFQNCFAICGQMTTKVPSNTASGEYEF